MTSQAKTNPADLEFHFNVVETSDPIHLSINEESWEQALEEWFTSARDMDEVLSPSRLHHVKVTGSFLITYRFRFRTDAIGRTTARGSAYPTHPDTQGELVTDESEPMSTAVIVLTTDSQESRDAMIKAINATDAQH